MNIKITGTGSCIPKNTKLNSGFSENSFYDSNGVHIESSNSEIIEKFKAITGIEKRRYINDNETVADIAIEAAIVTIKDSKVDPETIDYIIVAHNVGDITLDSHQVNTLPSLASKVKAGLKIQNPNCVAYDICLVVLDVLKVLFKQKLLLKLIWQWSA